MSDMTISHFADNNRTVITYRSGADKIVKAYSDTGIKSAERKFREEFDLKGKRVKKTIFEH